MTIPELYNFIGERKKKMPKSSYTSELFKSGLDRITQKVGEEAIEVVIASKNHVKQRKIEEISDLVYHLLVLMVESHIKIEDIEKELSLRHSK